MEITKKRNFTYYSYLDGTVYSPEKGKKVDEDEGFEPEEYYGVMAGNSVILKTAKV